ncbi:hypothetical protein ABPG72_015388 [Tetrahymena utriculariae]
MYQLVHQLNIIGYAQDNNGIFYSYSQSELVKYNSQQQGQLICSFNQNVQEVYSVSSSFLIILFQSSLNLQTYYRGECDDLTIQQSEQITNVYILDDTNYIILVEFYTKAILYQVNEYDSISSNMYIQLLQTISQSSQILQINIYQYDQTQTINNENSSQFLVVLFNNGILQIYSVIDFDQNSSSQPNQFLINLNQINTQSQSLVNQIIVNKQLGNIILLGQGLSLLEVDFSKNIVLKTTVKKNISQTKTEHTNSVIGFVNDASNNRFISYSLDGSFIVWQEIVDQFSGLIKVRFVLQQFHPICASSISSLCPYQMQSLELAQSNLLIAQYSNDNHIYVYNYQYDAVWLNNTFNLTDPSLKLNNYHFLKKNLTLTLCNAKQIAAFNISTANIIYNKLVTTLPFLYGAIDFQSTINDAQIGNYIIYILQQNSASQFLKLELIPDGTIKINQSINKSINATYYIQETMEMVVVTPNFLYIMNQTLYIYNIAVQTPSAISYEPQSKNFILFQANQKITYMSRNLTTYTAQRSFTFSSVISRQAVSANSPEMYFFYQNTQNTQLQNQIYALGPNLDIQMVVSFQNKIASLTAIQQSQKMYIGFQNGDIQSGYFNTNYLQRQISVITPQFQYVQQLNRVYYFDKDIKYLKLYSNSTTTVVSGQLQQLNGVIIDQVFQNLIGFTNSNMYYNFFIFDLNKNTLKFNITEGNQQGTTSAYLDATNGYLISYYNGTNQFFVWRYPNITYLYSCQDHINIYNDIVSGSDQPSSIVYNVGYIFLISQQNMILSTNNFGGIDRYFYNNNTSIYIQMKTFSKVFLDNQQQMLYISYTSQISYCTVIVYDTNKLQQQYINGNSFLKDIQGVIFQGRMSYIYDQTTLNAIDRISFKLLLTITSNNPSFQSVIISEQLNYVIVWNNQQINKNSNIAIFSLVDGTKVFTISSYQQIDSGSIDTVVLDEDSQQLFITKDSYFFMFSFDLQSFQYSGYYFIGYDTAVTQMQFLPNLNMIILLDASKISIIRCETSINTKNNFRSIYLTQNDDYFQNQSANKSYFLDKQNTAWSYNYQNFEQSYLFQLDQIRLTTQWGNNIYVILNNTLIQYDLNMNQLNSYQGRFKNIWFDNNFIFLEQVQQGIILLNQTNLQINQYFSTQLSSFIQSFLIIQSYQEVIILLQNSIIWHINYLNGQVINNYQASSPINALQFDFNVMTLMYIMPTSVQFFTNFTSNRVNFYNLFSQSYNSTLSNNITNVVFDYQSNQMIVVYKNVAYLQVFSYQYNSTTNLTLNNIVLIGQITLPLRTPDLQVYLNANKIQIVCPWQAVFISRKSLIPISYLRDNRYIKSITGYIPSDSQPQYILVTSDQFLYLLVLNPQTQKQNILYSFKMIYPRIIKFKIDNQGEVLQFNIVGTSNSIFFSYNFLLPPNMHQVTANSIQIQSYCFENLGVIKYSYSQHNQLTTLQNSLNQLQIQLQQSLIYVSPTESFYENVFFKNKNNKIIFQNQDTQSNTIIQLQTNSFQKNYLQNLQIANMIFDISTAKNINFNQNTIRITFENIKITNNGDGFSFNFLNIEYLVLENFQISDIQLQNYSQLFSVQNCSTIYFNNMTLNNIVLTNKSSLFEFTNSNNIFINNLSISNLLIDSQSNTHNIIHLFNSKYITIQNCNFVNISSANILFQTNFLLSEATKQLNLLQINYINIGRIPFISFVDSYQQNQYLYQITHNFLSMSNINATKIQNLNSSLISFIGDSFIVQSSNFYDIKCDTCLGGAIYTKNAFHFKLSNTQLQKINAFIGGAIYIMDSNYNEIILENCNFISNSALASGGALYLKKSDLQLHNSTFIDNQALVGGAIRYTDIEPLFAYNQILKLADDNNTFVNNTGTIHTNNFGSYTHSVKILSNNSDISLISYRRQLQSGETQTISNDYLINEYKVTEFQSGGSINLTFEILDLEGNPVNFDLDKYKNNQYPDIINQEISSFVINANTFSEQLKLFGQQSTNYQQFNQETNSFLISDLTIYSLPQTENLIYIQVPSIQRLVNSNQTSRAFSAGPFYSRLVFQFRKCVAGEIYQESNKLYICSECKDGFYSLVEPKQTKYNVQNCQRCPDGASDCYKNTIKLKQGYWRISNSTDSIVYCSNQPSNCNGDESKSYCKEGNFGPLCEMCDNNGVLWGTSYISNGNYGCVKCSTLMNNSSYILPSALAGLIMIIYLIFSIKIAINISENIVIGFYLRCLKLLPVSKSAYLDTTNMNIKSMMNYMQLAKLVNTFSVQLPSWLQILPQYLGSPIDNFLYTFDCYLNQIANKKIPLIYLRTIWTLVIPIMYIIGMSLLYFIFVKLKWTKFDKNHIISGLVFLIYFLQSNMVSNLLSVMACREIDNQKYILADVTYSCYTKTHIQYIFTICIPGLLLWAVILPIFIIRTLSKNKNSLDNYNIRIPYGFLYQDYKQQYYYWEFVRSYLKIIIIVVMNFYGDPYNNKLVIAAILFLLYLVLLQKAQPYNMIYYQQVDKRSIVVLIIIILMNIFLYNKPEIIQQQLFYIIVLGIDNVYQAYLVFEVVKNKLIIIFKYQIRNIKLQILEYFPILKKYIKIDTKSTLGVFFFWIFVRKQIIEMKKKKAEHQIMIQQHLTSVMGYLSQSERMNLQNHQSPISMFSQQETYQQRIDIGSFVLQDRENEWFQSNINSNTNLQNHANISSAIPNNNSQFQKSAISNVQENNVNSKNVQDDIQDMQIIQRKKSIKSQKEDFQVVSIIYKNLRKIVVECEQININILSSEELNKEQQVYENEQNILVKEKYQENIPQQIDSQQLNQQVQDYIIIQKQEFKQNNYNKEDYDIKLKQQKIIQIVQCKFNCQKCDFVLRKCQRCQPNYIYNEEIQQCQSSCGYGRYFQKETGLCSSSCSYPYIQDEITLSCKHIEQCPYLEEIGQQYLGQNFYMNFTQFNVVILEDLQIKNIIIRNKKVDRVQDIYIEQLIIDNIFADQTFLLESLLLIQNSKKVHLNNIQISKISSFEFIYFMQGFGIAEFLIRNLNFKWSNKVSFLQLSNSYIENSMQFIIKNDYFLIQNATIVSVNDVQNSVISLTGNSFIISAIQIFNVSCYNCQGAAIQVFKTSQFFLQDSLFQFNLAEKGGAIYIVSNYYNNTIIKSSKFLKNEAINSGGAIFLVYSYLQMYNTTIQENQALVGGEVRYIGIQPDFINQVINKNIVDKNTINSINRNNASIHSNNFGSYSYPLKVTSDRFDKNYENQIISTIEQDSIQVFDIVTINNFQSGGNIDVKLQILDLENVLINFYQTLFEAESYPLDIIEEIYHFKIITTMSNDKIKVYGQYISDQQQFNPNNRIFSIKDMNIVSIPESQNYFFFEVPSISRAQNNNQYYYFKKGSVQLQKFLHKADRFFCVCQEFKEGFYSLSQPDQCKLNQLYVSNIKNSLKYVKANKQSQQQCERCPGNAEKCYKNKIFVKNGYWRISNQTDVIIKCSNNEKNCNSDELTGYCKEGHVGPLCEQCDYTGDIWGSRYMSDGKYNSINCKDLQNDIKFLLPSILVGVFMIFYILFSVKMALNISQNIIFGYYLRKLNMLNISKSAYQDTTNMNMKPMMNYIQISSLINTFEVDLPGSPVNNFMYTLDCFLSTLQSQTFLLIFLTTIWALLIPAIYILLAGMIYFILAIQQVDQSSQYSFLQPKKINNLLSIFSCRKIDQNFYILADVSYQCYTNEHINFILSICIPRLVLWGFILPMSILKILFKHKDKLDYAKIRLPYGFLFQDYKCQRFYWEFIKSNMKILIVVVLNFYGNPFNNKLVIIMIILLLYQVSLSIMKTYQMKYFQQLEKKIMVTLTVIAIMNIFLYNQPDKIQQQIFYLVVLGIHSIYLAYLIFEVVKAKLSIAQKKNLELIFKKKQFNTFHHYQSLQSLISQKILKYFIIGINQERKYQEQNEFNQKRSIAKIKFNQQQIRNSTSFDFTPFLINKCEHRIIQQYFCQRVNRFAQKFKQIFNNKQKIDGATLFKFLSKLKLFNFQKHQQKEKSIFQRHSQK